MGVCVLVRWLLDDFFLHKFFSAVFFYPTIILAAYWCGSRPALLAIGLRPVNSLFVHAAARPVEDSPVNGTSASLGRLTS